MTIQEVILALGREDAAGFQVSKRNGLISSTWLIYTVKERYYYFDINQKIAFEDRYAYTETELLHAFQGDDFTIEMEVGWIWGWVWNIYIFT